MPHGPGPTDAFSLVKDTDASGCGRGFGGFLDLCEKIFFLREKPGAVIPPQVEFFFRRGEDPYMYIYIDCSVPVGK